MLFFLSVVARAMASSVWSREMMSALLTGFTGRFFSSGRRPMRASREKEHPTAGMFLSRYFPTRLSKRPPPMREVPFSERISKMFPV